MSVVGGGAVVACLKLNPPVDGFVTPPKENAADVGLAGLEVVGGTGVLSKGGL